MRWLLVVFEDWVGIDRLALPPSMLGRQAEDCEMQVRRILCCVAGASDVTDHVAPSHVLSLSQSVGVPIEVRVVVGERLGWVELVDRETACLAREELLDSPGFDGVNRCMSRRHDVERFMSACAASVGK